MKTSAEAIARAVRLGQSGRGRDISQSESTNEWKPLDPSLFLYNENVIDGTEFAYSTKGDTMPLKEMEDVRPPFPLTIVGFSIDHIYRDEPDWNTWNTKRVSEGYGEDYVYFSFTRWEGDESIDIYTGAAFENKSGEYLLLVPAAMWNLTIDPDTGSFSGDNLKYSSYLNWVREDGYDESDGYVLRSTLGIFNMANCANVEIVEPHRPRAVRRRIQRDTQTAITNLMIRSKVRRYDKGTISQQDEGHMPLHTVRGHVSHYGDCCPGSHEPRGKLFGKYDRKVWVPAHARGSEDNGVRIHNYAAKP